MSRLSSKSVRRRSEPPRWRRLPRMHARSEVKRLRNPVLRALGDADQAVLRTLRSRGHGTAAETSMKALGAAGEWAAVWVAIGAAGVALDGRRRRRWLSAACVGPAAVGVNYLVKVGVGRERPLIEGHPPLARAPSKLSFPSAHATSSLAAATAMGRVSPGAKPALLALAGAICFSRSYLGMHYPSDVLAGAALGVALGRLAPGLAEDDAEERLIDLVVSRADQPAAEASGSNGAGGSGSAAASEASPS